MSAIKQALKEWCDNCDPDAFSPTLAAEADKELAEIVAALQCCVEQLSPGCVDVVIKPDCEPYSIKLAKAALSRFKVSQ